MEKLTVLGQIYSLLAKTVPIYISKEAPLLIARLQEGVLIDFAQRKVHIMIIYTAAQQWVVMDLTVAPFPRWTSGIAETYL